MIQSASYFKELSIIHNLCEFINKNVSQRERQKGLLAKEGERNEYVGLKQQNKLFFQLSCVCSCTHAVCSTDTFTESETLELCTLLAYYTQLHFTEIHSYTQLHSKHTTITLNYTLQRCTFVHNYTLNILHSPITLYRYTLLHTNHSK